MTAMNWATVSVRTLVRHFTTDQAVRAGVITAGWAAASSSARGLLPRTAVQQAAATGVTGAAYYALGATTWSTISSAAAGQPGHRPGRRALLAAATISAGGGKAAEVALRPISGDSLAKGIAWSEMKVVSVAGLAGGLVTLSDFIAHDALKLRRTPGTTLALDLGMGALMAGGSWVRRRRRARRYGGEHGHLLRGTQPPGGQQQDLAQRARSVAVVGATVVGSTVGLATLAVTEQAGARLTTRGIDRLAGRDLGEFSMASGHGVMFTGFAAVGVFGLRQVRHATEKKTEVVEAAYREAPTSEFVSCGPHSDIPFDAIGKDGRRFVLMRLSADDIEEVMDEPAIEPVRVVIPREGTVEERAQLAVRELEATGGLDRSLICVASPTGVGYVSYVMGEALEYLTRGDCAIVVPQYAYVPSALALNKTHEGTALQAAVLAAIGARLEGQTNPARVVQFGESLGAQVAADVAGPVGTSGFDGLGLDAGLYLGVPFRSSLWRAYHEDPESMSGNGRLVLVSEAGEIEERSGQHVMVIHHDDPINKFGYSMVVQRPWWMGSPQTRPPKVPRDTIFRPITSFVIAIVDLLNGMNAKPGEFALVGHDYRIDIREALQKTYGLPASAHQQERIEEELRRREQEWAERRLIARTGEKALRSVRDTFNSWGINTVNLQVADAPTDEVSSRLLEYLNQRLGQSGSSSVP